MKTVVIFGGSGFVGRHIINRMVKKGWKIIVPFQHAKNTPNLRHFSNSKQIDHFKFENLNEEKILKSIDNADVIINLKTLWQEKKASFKMGIYKFNADLSKIIKKKDINKTFIFFSGLGIDDNLFSERTKMIMSSEKFIKNNLLNVCILRPGIIIGEGDSFLSKLIPIFKLFPIIPVFGSGNSKCCPVNIEDVVEAVNRIIMDNIKGINIYELTGDEVFTYKELYSYICKCMDIRRLFFPMPIFLAKISAYFFEKLSINIITSEQVNLFKNDNLPSNQYKTFKNLNIIPKKTSEIIKKSLINLHKKG